MKSMTIEKIAEACGGRITGPRQLGGEVTDIVIDSRKAAPNCMFAAIKGENADGHDFISQAARAGAVCCLCERKPEDFGITAVVVDSVTAALRDIAQYYRGLFSIPFIGITGSVGKTTTKEMIARVLEQRHNVLKTEGNFNNELGVPLTLFRLRDEHEAAVVEMGISQFGEMNRLAKMVKPDIAVFSAIGYAHLEFLGSLEGVLQAKSEMLEYVPDDGAVIVNGDDRLLVHMQCPQRKLTFGVGEGCDVRAVNIGNSGIDGMRCDIICGPRMISAKIPGFGVHLVSAALAAAAVGIQMGLTDEQISDGIAAYTPVGRRSSVEKTDKYILIDDCYNSNPTSAASSIASLAMLGGRRVCILGDMRELGESSARLHYDIGALAGDCGIDVIIACGEQSENIYKGAVNKARTVRYFPDKDALLAALNELLLPGDRILIKASRGMHFEDVSEAIKQM